MSDTIGKPFNFVEHLTPEESLTRAVLRETLAREIFTRAVSSTASDLDSISGDHAMMCNGYLYLERLARAAHNAAAAFLAETERRRTLEKP